MKILLSCGALLLSLILAAACPAGEKEGAFSVSPFGGGYTFDGTQHLKTAPVYGLRLGYDLTDNWGEEWVVDFLSTKGTHDQRSVNALSYRLDILYNFMAKGPYVPYLALGGGGITAGHGSGFNAGRSNTSATMNAGGGLKYFITDSVAMRADARQLAIFDHKTVFNWEYTGGLTFLFGAKKAAVAAVAPSPPTCTLSVSPSSIGKGEPAKLSWSSQNAAKCRIQPGIGPVDTQGSTTVTPAADTTYTLSCSGEGGDAESNAAVSVSAPPPPVAPTAALSIDPSSVMKGEKAALKWNSTNATDCAIQPEIGAVKPQGSREIIPSGDAVYTLTCTGPGGKAASEAKIAVAAPVPTREELCMTLNIEYDTDKAVIKPVYYPEVEKVANFMRRFPQVKGTIEGHTDNVASAKYNEKLSLRRATGVVKMLVEKYGIDRSRIKPVGYGLTRPIADNGTAEGRQRNRRTVANFGCVSVEKK
ncbi:MAG TPA: OmpA family protein [Geobacteraceae bacterium]